MEQVHEINSQETFSSFIKENVHNLVVVHFWAPWAPQCQQMNDVMSELLKDSTNKNVKFVKVEAESVPEVSQQYEIVAVPTVLLLKNFEVVDRVNGVNAAELTQKVQTQAVLVSKTTATKELDKPRVDLNTRLKTLINLSPVMLFMKGSPNEPKCGFSRQITQLLGEQGITFNSFDILTDNEVREGLKKFSDWPTYPQLYVNGDLLGGLDIVKEMIASNELKNMIPESESLEDRLKKIIKKEKVMLFMKGSPSQPRCGFSKTTVGILGEENVSYGHFDILEDEEVRQGLKKFSNWPTYPQLYVNGELVGGLDIIKELKESGDLESTLKGT